MQAYIYQINLSNGGVPKLPQPSAEVETLGLVGDAHRDLKHHGGPMAAVCLFSLERIQALQAEGHSIYPGSIGENLTLAGLDWSQLEPGRQLQLGDTVVLEITSYTIPCSNIAGSFMNGTIARVSQKVNPGWSRLYARVLRPGRIQVNDPVWVIQEPAGAVATRIGR